MKKIFLMLAIVIIAWSFQPVSAQTNGDTTKNHVEVTKKTKTRRQGRKITTVTKMEGTGTPGAISTAADEAVTGKPKPVAAPAPPAPPTVVVVEHKDETPPPPPPAPAPAAEPAPRPVTTSTTTTKTTSSHVVHGTHVYHKVYRKKPVTGVATTTTTTVKKTQTN